MATYTGDAQPNTLTGDDADDSLFGLGANDTLRGEGGNDTLDGGTGSDALYGGTGDDTYIVDAAGDQVFENAGEGFDTIHTRLTTYTLAPGIEVERLVYAGTFNFVGIGNASDNVIEGGAGTDGLYGGAGADTLIGGHNNDALYSGGTVVNGVAVERDDGLEHDVLQGGGGQDRASIGYGDDADGGSLFDTLSISLTAASAGVTLDTAGIISGGAYVLGGGTIQNFESVATIWGSGFDDALTIATQAGLVTIYGGAGDDTVVAGDGGVAFHGGAGADSLTGGNGSDSYYFDALADLDPGDSFDGGGGSDTVYFASGLAWDMTAMAIANVENVVAYAGAYLTLAQADQLTSFTGIMRLTTSGVLDLPTVQGTVYLADAPGNQITFGVAAITLYGGAANDVITGGTTSLIDGGGGNDTITGSNSVAANLRGNSGDDTLIGGTKGDTLAGGEGVDDVRGGDGDDTIQILLATDIAAGDAMDGGAGHDTLSWIRAGALDLSGTTITGIEELRVLDPAAGVRMTIAQFGGFQNSNSVIEFADGGTVALAAGGTMAGIFRLASAATVFDGSARYQSLDVQGGAGDDSITGGHSSDVLRGGDGADTLSGMDGIDSLYGEGGNDELRCGAGDDKLYGGTGDDIYHVEAATDQLFENVGEGTDTAITALASLTLAANVEKLVYSGSGAFAGTGNAGQNVLDATLSNGATLKGMAGSDLLAGGLGNDTLDGGTESDSMIGGAGDDTYLVDNVGDSITENAGEGTDLVRSSVSFTLGANVENLTLTGGAAANATGNDLANILIGNGSANVLDGGLGADRMEGGNGGDTYRIDNANDVIVEANTPAGGADKAMASVNYTLKAGVAVETLTTDNDFGVSTINLNGNEFANRILGNAGTNALSGGQGDDRLEGFDGNDTLNGGAGADLMIGGAGSDVYVVDNALDKILEVAGGGTDSITLMLAGGSYTIATEVERMVVMGANTEAHGNSFANVLTASAAGVTLYGEGGNDTLNGSANADIFHGGVGNDIIKGLGGADVFVFDTALSSVGNADTLVDFEHGVDTIELSGSVFGAIAAGTLDASAFGTGTAATTADQRIVYDTATGKLFYDADGSGAGAQVLFAVLQNKPADLAASDFHVTGAPAPFAAMSGWLAMAPELGAPQVDWSVSGLI